MPAVHDMWSMTLEPRRIALTTRDLALLRFITENRTVLLEDLASRFFAFDPITRKPNRNPLRACERRLQTLANAEYLRVRLEHDGTKRRRVATLGREAAGLTCARVARRRVAPRMRAHHLRTLDAIRDIDRFAHIAGGRVVEQKLEADIRSVAQRGRRTRPGDRYEPFPDAVVIIEYRDGRRKQIAVEYVTSKYTDADILAKHASFRAYDRVYWFSDRASTTRRVERITGAPCTTLS